MNIPTIKSQYLPKERRSSSPLSAMNMMATTIRPVECPRPQRNPKTNAFHDVPTERAAKADK